MKRIGYIALWCFGIVFCSMQLLAEADLRKPLLAALAGLGHLPAVAVLFGTGAALLAYHLHSSRRRDKK